LISGSASNAGIRSFWSVLAVVLGYPIWEGAIMAPTMSLCPGKKIAHYEIIALLGVGGMGEVYRARDIRLARDVALKTLPSSFIDNPQYRVRLQREAQVLAGFNHPHIAALYGLEEWNGGIALIMELVEGLTLAERIRSRPIAIHESLRIARDVADALEAAHEKGIIHRDLKPSNIKLSPAGTIKVLDFGLAKTLARDTLDRPILDSPTLSIGNTAEGIILGTAAYMSPEQARGKPVDRRSDVWSFGCVLYELLTGQNAFSADTPTDILAMVIQRDPDWTSLPPGTPENIRVLLRRCLQKDPKQRLHDIADARIEIEDALHQETKQVSTDVLAAVGPRRWTLTVSLLMVAFLSAAVVWGLIRIAAGSERMAPRLTSVSRLTHDPDFSQWPTWSPDGKMLAFSSNRSGNFEIYVRRIQGGQEVNVTNDPAQDIQPDFSPDGNWIVFVSTRSSRTKMIRIGWNRPEEYRTVGGDIWIVPALGGQARLLARDGNVPVWHPSGSKIIYVSGVEDHRSLMEVTADGAPPRTVLSSDSSNWEIGLVRYSPSGRWITFETSQRRVFLLSAKGGSPRLLLTGSSHVWDPSGQRIYYCRRDPSGGTHLESFEIDENSGELKAEPKSLSIMTGRLNDLAISRDGNHLAASVLESSLNVSRLPLNSKGDAAAGDEQPLTRGEEYDHMPTVSPDGRSIAYTCNRLGDDELWILNVATKFLYRVEIPGTEFVAVSSPHWFPDGRKLFVLRTTRDGNTSIWIVAADGSHAEVLPIPPFASAGEGFPVSPDGRTIVYSARVERNSQLFAFNVETSQGHQLTTTPGDKYSGSWSPDGKSLVYSSNASGSVQLWRIDVVGGEPRQLTSGEDRIRHAFYSPDGRWLYYQPNHQNIYRMPASGGEPVQQVTHFAEAGLYIEEPTVSPDGHYVVYCRGNGGSSLWLLKIDNK
jgi:eukaryotic-like serine/threonine-protein kinase